MNNQTPTPTCDCTHTQACKECAEAKGIDWSIIDRSAPQAEPVAFERIDRTSPTEQTAETFFEDGYITRNNITYVTERTARTYADLRIKETLEAAAKELPTMIGIESEMERRGFNSPTDRMHGRTMTRWMREQAAPIIAYWKAEANMYKGVCSDSAKEIDELRSRIGELEEVLIKYQSATDELYNIDQQVRDILIKHIGTIHQPEKLTPPTNQ